MTLAHSGKKLYFLQKVEISEACKRVHCVDLEESFQTHIYLQNFVSIQPRTAPLQVFASSTWSFAGASLGVLKTAAEAFSKNASDGFRLFCLKRSPAPCGKARSSLTAGSWCGLRVFFLRVNFVFLRMLHERKIGLHARPAKFGKHSCKV